MIAKRLKKILGRALYTYVRMYVLTHVYVRTVYLRTYVRTYACVHVYVHMYVCVLFFSYTGMYTLFPCRMHVLISLLFVYLVCTYNTYVYTVLVRSNGMSVVCERMADCSPSKN